MKDVISYKIDCNEGNLSIEGNDNTICRSDDIIDIFSYLTRHDDKDYIYTAWNVDEFISPVFRLLNEDTLTKLHKTNKVKIGQYSLFYIQGKMVGITNTYSGNNGVKLYSLDQYFPKVENEPEALGEYVEKVIEALDIMKLSPSKFTSPIGMYEECVMNHFNLPRPKKDPSIYPTLNPDDEDELMEFGLECAGRLWIEAYKVGYFEKVWDIDINACFPNITRNMVDTRHLTWMKSNKYQSDAIYGYCKGQVTINEKVLLHPIPYYDSEGRSHTPVGTWRTFLTKSQIDFIHKWKIGRFEIEKGYWGLLPGNLKSSSYPFKNAIDKILKFKANENETVSFMAKRQGAGIYGMMTQRKGDSFGDYFNPVIGAEISTRASLQVADFIYTNKLASHVIRIAVDGITLDNEIKLNGSKQWKLHHIGPCISVSSGLCFINSSKPEGITINELLQAIEDSPSSSVYPFTLPRIIKLGEVVKNGNIEELGTLQDRYTTINLKSVSRKRIFPKFPKNGHQIMNNVYNSLPITIIE